MSSACYTTCRFKAHWFGLDYPPQKTTKRKRVWGKWNVQFASELSKLLYLLPVKHLLGNSDEIWVLIFKVQVGLNWVPFEGF